MSEDKSVVVETSLGALAGGREQEVLVFRGIPYGAPTDGEHRFKPPSPAAAWTGVREANKFGAVCPQTGSLAGTNRLADEKTIGPLPDLPLTEDCLSLNVWTPASDRAKRPVLFWLHGRGFAQGSGSEGWYSGAKLAESGDVVVVTINHRLNVFGYLHLADIAGEEFAGSGVAGMLDAVLALEWVRDNIAGFGGDPDNVTIFGESGGGAKVSTLLGMPKAQGLFHRAVIQSGPGLQGQDPGRASEYALKLLGHFNLGAKDVRQLQNVPSAELVAGMTATTGRDLGSAMALRPVVDGLYLPAHPFDPVAAPPSVQVPVMIGTNKDESALFAAGDPKRRKLSEEDLLKRLERMLGDRRDEVLAVYRRERPDATPWDLYIGIRSEGTRLRSIQLAERKAAAGGAPVFMYLFTFESNAMGGLFKAAHALEIPFVFNNPDIAPFTGSGDERYQLAQSMSSAWVNFARNGDPNGPGLPQWPAYDADKRATMLFNVPCAVENDPRRAEREVWKDQPVLGI